jgi:hypothetical protein
MWTAPTAPMGFFDSKRFTAALIWLIGFGVCYLADAGEFVRAAIPAAFTLVFLLSFRQEAPRDQRPASCGPVPPATRRDGTRRAQRTGPAWRVIPPFPP